MSDSGDERRDSARPALLSRHANAGQRCGAPSRGDKLQRHAAQLSRYLQSLVITGYNSSDLADDELDRIRAIVSKIVRDLEAEHKAPSCRLGDGERVFEALNVLSFALLVLDDKKERDSEMGRLKRKLRELQKSYDVVVAKELNEMTESQRVLKLVSGKFGLENVTSFEEFVEAMEQRENEKDVQIQALEAQVVTLSKKNKKMKRLAMAAEDVKRENEVLETALHATKDGDESAELYVLRAEVQTLKSKCAALESDLKLVKASERNMKKEKMEAEKMANDEIQAKQSLAVELQRIKIEIEELKNGMENREVDEETARQLAMRTEQVSRLNGLTESLGEQVEQLTEELLEVSSQRAVCLALIQKQNNLLDQYEKELGDGSSTVSVVAEAPSSRQESVASEGTVEVKCEDYVLDLIKQRGAGLLSDETISILDNETTSFEDKIAAVLHASATAGLDASSSSSDERVEALEKENRMLTSRLADMVKFMNKLTNSEELLGQYVDDSYESKRDILVAQCRRVEHFLSRADLGDVSIPELLKCADAYNTNDPQELRTLLEHNCLVNDMMMGYCKAVQDHAEMLTMQLNEMKTEAAHLDDHINDATFELHEELDEVKRQRDNAVNALGEFQKQLAGECNEKYPIQEEVLLEISRRFPDMAVGYQRRIAELEEQLQDYELLQKELASLEAQAEKRKRKLTALRNAVAQKVEENTGLEIQLEDMEKQLKAATDRIEKLHEDNGVLQETLQEMTATVSEMEGKKQQEVDAVRREVQEMCDTKVNELNQQIVNLEENLRRVEDEKVETEKRLKKEHQKEKEELHKTISEQARSAEELRVNMESLIVELREKLQEERELLTAARKRISEQEDLYQEMKSELSAAHISQKMTESKMSALEERTKREKALFEGQTKIKILNLETQYENEIESLKLEMNQKVRNILVKVCEVFKRYYDFREQITEDSVFQLTNKVTQVISELEAKNAEYDETYNDLHRIYKVMNAKNAQDAMAQLRFLISIKDQFDKLEQDVKEYMGTTKDRKTQDETISRLQQEVKVWLLWAKKLHAMATEEFSIRKSSQDLRFVIEEALMAAIGQRQIWRRIEILRTEKQLLTQNDATVLFNDDSNHPKTLRHHIAAFVAIYRLQKLSGHVHCLVTLPLAPGVQRAQKPSQIPQVPLPAKHRYPIFDAM